MRKRMGGVTVGPKKYNGCPCGKVYSTVSPIDALGFLWYVVSYCCLTVQALTGLRSLVPQVRILSDAPFFHK